MKLTELYNLIKEEEDNSSKIDVNKAIEQGYYTVKGVDPNTGKESDYVHNISGIKKYSKPLADLYDTVKFYKEAEVPENIKKLAIKIMTAINTVRRDLGTFDSTVHVYQQTLKESK